jgi:hypothetical protein
MAAVVLRHNHRSTKSLHRRKIMPPCLDGSRGDSAAIAPPGLSSDIVGGEGRRGEEGRGLEDPATARPHKGRGCQKHLLDTLDTLEVSSYT